MNYRLIKPMLPNYTAVEQVLFNRGISKNDSYHFLNTTDDDINSFLLFGENVLKEAAIKLITCIKKGGVAIMIIDCDCDGYTASATLINYLYDCFPEWTENNLMWFIHSGKQHGLSDFPNETIQADLIICPDSSSNDYQYHKILKDRGIDVIVLDHHEAEYISEDATVINNQLSDYPNKQMSGVGVTWQFCRYLDSLMGLNYADDYLDLVALGMDADMMSMTSLETKHLIIKGLQDVKNPFIAAMADKNSFSLGGKLTPIGIAFYIAPYVNAINRSGTLEEKELVFKSMLKHKAFEKIPSNKRGHKPGEMEMLYIQAIRTANNVKVRQTKAQDAGMTLLESMIEKNNLLDHKILLFLLEPGAIDRNIAGLAANKIMAKYQRPCCVLTKVTDNDGNVSYQGSARGCDKVGILTFKDICVDTGYTIFAEGHQGAFGIGIKEENIEDFIKATDIALKNMPSEPIYFVDYIYQANLVNPNHILEIASLEDIWGKDMDEPFIAVSGIRVTPDMVTIYRKKTNTMKIQLPNKVELTKFNVTEEECDKFQTNNNSFIEIDVVGRCVANEYFSTVTPQIRIEEYEIVDSSKYIF